MNGAKFDVSEQLLIDLLHMPEGTRILGIQKENPFSDAFTFYVTNDDLPRVAEGGLPQRIMPMMQTVKFDWNLKE